MSQTSIERAPRRAPMFPGTLSLKPRPTPQAEPPPSPAPPSAPAAPEAGRVARRIADLAECRRRFPAVFDADRPLPLAIGVHKPLGELIGFNRAAFLLAWWTSWPAYLRAVAAGGSRYALDGQEAGEISECQRGVAQAVIATRAAYGAKRQVGVVNGPADRSEALAPSPATEEEAGS
jgi:sRNA-binding protein